MHYTKEQILERINQGRGDSATIAIAMMMANDHFDWEEEQGKEK